MKPSTTTTTTTKLRERLEDDAEADRRAHIAAKFAAAPEGAVFEVRALGVEGFKGWRNPVQVSGYFDDAEAMAEAVRDLDDHMHRGVYATINPVRLDLLARAENRLQPKPRATTADEDVERLTTLLIDVDPIRPAGLSATDDEKAQAQERASRVREDLSTRGWPDPIVGDSGNGFYLLYTLDLPADDAELVRRVLEGLAAKYDDDRAEIDRKVFNPSRIAKVLGTWSRKGDHSEKTGRVHRRSRILSAPEVQVPVSRELLEAVAAEGAPAPETTPTAPNLDENGQARRARLWLEKRPGAVQGQGGHDDLFLTFVGLRDFGLDDATALDLFWSVYNPKCSPPWERSEAREVERKLQEARQAHRAPDPAKAPSSARTASTPRTSAPELPGRPARPLTDTGNAERFIDDHGENLRFVGAKGGVWYLWNGSHWLRDDRLQVNDLTKRTVRGIYGEAEAEDDDETRRAIGKWAKQSESKKARDAMLSLARSEPGVCVAVEDLDANPWLMTCANGTLNLQTGELMRPQREHLITKCARAAYDPAAEAPRFRRVLEEVIPDAGVRAFVQRLFGCALIGLVREQVLPVFWGGGANGKSTIVDAVRYAMGDHAGTAPPSMLMASKGERHPAERMTLKGVRLAIASETPAGQHIAEDTVKALTGGDQMVARGMGQDFVEWDPTHTLILLTNHKPHIRGTDNAIWRRVHLVPFTVQIPVERQDKGLPEALRAEADGILRWLVEGLRGYLNVGLAPPEAVLAATREYREAEDVLSDFIRDCCVIEPDASVPASALWRAYKEWAQRSGERVGTQRSFGLDLGERIDRQGSELAGVEKRRTNRGQTYIGLGLTDPVYLVHDVTENPVRNSIGAHRETNPENTSQGTQGTPGNRKPASGLAGPNRTVDL